MLKKHISIVHEEERELNCPQCDKAFTRLSVLKQHMSTVHDAKLDKHFLDASQLSEKSADSSGSTMPSRRDGKCPICDKVIKQGYNLARHISIVHEGQLDYKCPQCDKAFGRRYVLIKHISRVHDKKLDKNLLNATQLSEKSAVSSESTLQSMPEKFTSNVFAAEQLSKNLSITKDF